jgi:hypothetical protein
MSWFASEEPGHSKWESLHKYPRSGRAEIVSLLYIEFTGKETGVYKEIGASTQTSLGSPRAVVYIAVGDPHLLMAAMVSGEKGQ